MKLTLTTSARPRILIVNDEPLVQAMFIELLAVKYSCQITGSAEEARAQLARNNYALVICDLDLPDCNGLELLSELHGRYPQAVVLMLSGLKTLDTTIEALRRGAFDYITKPFNPEEVERAIERALQHQAMIEANRHYEKHLEELLGIHTVQMREMNLRINQMFESLYLNYRATLHALAAALEARDTETEGHSQRVVAYCLRLGQALALSNAELIALEHGALLHDIGKIGIPDEILLKPGKLNHEEWVIMRQHIEYGEQILNQVELLQDARDVVTQHHEKWDGSGYPRGLKGEEISLNARIFAVADAVDAITSDRPYRQSNDFEAAVKELQAWSGRHFDPKVVDAFLAIPLEEWQMIRSSVLQGASVLDSIHLHGIRSMILSQKIDSLKQITTAHAA